MPCFRFQGAIICTGKQARRREKFMGLRWPATRNELYAAGYVREMNKPARPCKRCGTRIEFWRTPANQLMPIEVSKENDRELLCHFATCPHADEFRQPLERKPKQRELLFP
jgi:hypothetical protein